MKNFILSVSLLFSLVIVKAQNITLYDQFLGKYDFTMIGNTLNPVENGGGSCTILTQSSATLNLGAGQTIQAAYLYWAGSGSLAQADLNIKLNGTDITADRTFNATVGSVGLPVFGAFSDVTAQVLATGNGIYTVSDLDLTAIIPPYCGTGGNFGGWSIVIVYEDLTLTNNLVNVYDGFAKVDANTSEINIQLTNLNVLHLVGNKIGFLAWEGDESIALGEQLKINNNVISNPPLNPANNAFNGTNSFTGSNTLYNMDLDFYDINSFTNIGDNTLTVSLQSSQDAVIVNNIVLVLNSEVPDATIDIDPLVGPCDVRDINVDYTVHNTIATDILPAGTPIAFYADGVLVDTSATINDIAIGGQENNSITLTIPNTVPSNFNLNVKVDDDGAGNSTIIEFLEDNNTDEIEIQLRVTPSVFPADVLRICDLNNDGMEVFNLTIPGNQIVNAQPGVTIRYYEDENDANAGNGDFISTPGSYNGTSASQTIYVRLEDITGCFIISNFTIEIIPQTAIVHTIPDMESCIEGPASTGILTDLTTQDPFVLNGNNAADYVITYHTSEISARQGTVTIPNPAAYPNASSPEQIWVRMESDEHCVEYGSFNLIYNLNPVLQEGNLESCSLDGPGTFHLPDANETVITGTGLQFDYYETFADAQAPIDPLPDNYTPDTESATVFVRVTDEFGCFSIIAVELETVINHAEITDVYEVCDDPRQINDGITQFDLTTYSTQVENALVIPGAIISYYTTEANAIAGTNPIPNPAEFENTTNPQVIYARAANPDGGCGGVAEFSIEVSAVPEFTLPDYIAFCEDDEPVYNFGESFVTYTWADSNGNVIGNSSTVEFQNEGIHTLEVTSSLNDCPAIREVEVIFDHSPIITSIEIDGNTVTVYPTGGIPPYEYSYNNGLTWHDYFILTDVESGIHDMLVRSKYGCVSDAKTFGVLGIPNVITPNGDGYNDYWEIRALEAYPDTWIKIFDRYGKMFMDREIGENFRWDGKYLSQPVPSGDYWYIITLKDGRSISGHVSVRNK